jgi:hypothetical protein
VDTKGAKLITARTSGYEETHYTAVLACFADGTKPPPLLKFHICYPKITFQKEFLSMFIVMDGWVKMG